MSVLDQTYPFNHTMVSLCYKDSTLHFHSQVIANTHCLYDSWCGSCCMNLIIPLMLLFQRLWDMTCLFHKERCDCRSISGIKSSNHVCERYKLYLPRSDMHKDLAT